MNIQLTSEEKYELKQRHRRTKNKGDADKIKIILMFSDGYTAAEIANVLLLSDDTVRRWIESYKWEESVEMWLKKNYLVYEGKLSKEEETTVEAYVVENVISDSKKVKEFIERNFGKTYSLSGITSLLKRLGFVYKKTVLVPSKYDPIHQIQCKVSYEVLGQMLSDRETIFFMDGVHPQHNTTCTSAWIKKGETIEIKSNTGRERVNWNGVYNPINQDVLLHESKTIDADSILEMLKKIEQLYPEKEKIYIIPTAVDDAEFVIKDRPAHFVKKYHLENSLVILTIARLNSAEHKGYDRVMKALPLVLQEVPRAKYVLVGKGNDERVNELLKDPLIKEHVILTGRAENNELIDYYNLADVFVMPSKFEGFGIVHKEALICGRPVIASNEYGGREALLNDELGLSVRDLYDLFEQRELPT
jgi:glycosyltransferase involved in cell wall biosynthesis